MPSIMAAISRRCSSSSVVGLLKFGNGLLQFLKKTELRVLNADEIAQSGSRLHHQASSQMDMRSSAEAGLGLVRWQAS